MMRSQYCALRVLFASTLSTAVSAAPATLVVSADIYNDTVSVLAVEPPAALPEKATTNDLRWQPALDFDQDGCYNVPAIDADSNVAEGLENNWVGLASDCRDLSDLENNNVYSRQRCNNGWCAYIYDYYFEKDVSVPYFLDPGHRHDWEHVAVWVKDDQVEYVGVSQHGAYEIRAVADIPYWDGEHVKPPENHLGVWFRGDLVSYNGFPAGIRDVLEAADFGTASFALKDANFPGNLENSKPDGVTFDANLDEGSPGSP